MLNDLSEIELLTLARSGHDPAFAELWRRYVRWAHGVARVSTSKFDADDIVAEAFVKIFRSLRNGNGPSTNFATYLGVTIRAVTATWGRREARLAVVPLSEAEEVGCFADFTINGDVGTLESPFRSLPLRWQQVLWLTVVEELPLAEVALFMRTTPAGATQLAARARRAFRAAVAAHETAENEPLLLSAS